MTTQQKTETKPQSTGMELVPIDQVAIIRAKGTGEMRLMKTTTVLSVEDGTLVLVPGMGKMIEGQGWRQMFLVSAEGYKAQARNSGLQVVNAPTVIVDGVEQPNPFVQRDPKTGRPRMVHARALAYGFTRMGAPCRSDRTAVLDLDIYRLVDLMAKAKKSPAAFKILPVDGDRPGASWAKYPIDDATTLWADTAAAEFLKWQAEAVNRVKKAAELCQSFAQRNATKHHPNVVVHKTDGISRIPVTCWCWVPQSGSVRWDGSTYDVMVKRLSAANADAGETTDAQEQVQVQTIRGADAVHDEAEVIDVESKEIPEECDTPADESDGAGSGANKEQARVDAQIKTMRDVLPADVVLKHAQDAGIDMESGEAWEMADWGKRLKFHESLSKLLAVKAEESGKPKGKGK